MERHIVGWIIGYGPPLIFAAQLFGIFGVPIPDELLLTLAGVLVRRGQLSLAWTTVAAIAGCVAGITVSYALGRTFGTTAMHRLFRGHEHALQRTQHGFERFGGWLLAFGYYIPGVRHVTAISAGSMPLSYAAFAAYAYSGAVLWCATFLGLGYFAGDRWREALDSGRRHAAIAAIIATVLILAYGVWSRNRRGDFAR